MSHEKTAEFYEQLRERLKNGYIKTGELNSELSEEAVCSDNEALSVCEEKLMESE